MIISFYGEDFEGLQNNASLVVDSSSYSLIRRGVDLDELSCTCEAFTEDIQPTFIVVKTDKGKYVYGCLAGIPERTKENQTKINGTDLKTMLKSDVVLDLSKTWTSVNLFLQDVFNEWNTSVNQGSFVCDLCFGENVGSVPFDYLKPSAEKISVYNAWDDIFAPYLKYYDLFMTAELDLIRKKVLFTIGKSRAVPVNIKLWEYGIYDYGKWIADVNETQGAVLYGEKIIYGTKWILTSQNVITTDPSNRNIYPIKRKVVLKETDQSEEVETLKAQADQEALETLTESLFKEDLSLENFQADFQTRCNIYPKRGEGLYKALPVGELHYDATGLKKVQIGYRFTGIQFLF